MKKTFSTTKFFIIFFLAFFQAQTSFAELSFEISNKEAPKTKILFFGFNSAEASLEADALEVLLRIQRNLRTTNLFEVIQDNSLPQLAQSGEESDISDGRISKQIESMSVAKNYGQNHIQQNNFSPDGDFNGQNFQPLKNPLVSVEMLPDFAKYNAAHIGAIVVAQINYDIEGNLEIRLRLWDVLDQRQLFGKFYSASKDNYKRLANVISDEIFKALTGEKKGHFNSQILYVSESGHMRNRVKKITTIDFDGENRRFLTDGRDLVLTPIFSKNPYEIFYLSYRAKLPQIYKMSLIDNQSERVGGFYGTTFAASTHPKDPNIILLSAIYDGNSDIYEMHIKENRALRLTKSSAIDTTASYSPDGKTIAFVSDRDGGQKIYLMDHNGSNIRRLSYGDGSYSKPIYSPDGTMIAFTVVKRGQFFIGTMTANGANERLLTSAYLVEGAKFSPNGRYLIYSKTRTPYGKGSIPRLFTLDIATGFEYEVPLAEGEGATDPDWIGIE